MKIDLDRYEVFFFDFDGVIVDSVDIKAQAFGELFKECGSDVVKKVIDYHLNNGGVSRYEKFRYYYRNILNKRINQKIINDLDRRYSQLVVEKVVKAGFIKGVMDFIGELNRNRKECFIISATPKKEIKNIIKLRQIGRFFKEITGSPLTKKENLKYLLNKYHINPRRAIYFGDTKSDYEAAMENNIDFVGVASGKSKELRALHGIPKIKDFIV